MNFPTRLCIECFNRVENFPEYVDHMTDEDMKVNYPRTDCCNKY